MRGQGQPQERKSQRCGVVTVRYQAYKLVSYCLLLIQPWHSRTNPSMGKWDMTVREMESTKTDVIKLLKNLKNNFLNNNNNQKVLFHPVSLIMYLGKVHLYPWKCFCQTCKAIHLQINVLFLCWEVMFQFSLFVGTQLCLWSFPASANTWITHRLKDKGKKYVPWWCHLVAWTGANCCPGLH